MSLEGVIALGATAHLAPREALGARYEALAERWSGRAEPPARVSLVL